MTGTFVFSLDTELAWGTMDKAGFQVYRRHLERTREEIDRLLLLLERYQVPVTWAFVGHLFLGACSREHPEADPHPDVLTPNYAWDEGAWHRHDPGTDRQRDPFWYGDDILSKVLAAKPTHEIGCHTFSHIIMDDPAVTPAIARSQLQKCHELAEQHGIRLRSLVFPRDRVAHLPVVKEAGFLAYRGAEATWYRSYPRAFRPLCHYLDRFLSITPPVYRQLRVDEHGLVNVPGSMFLMPPDGVRRLIPGQSRVRQAVKGLEEAARTGGLFHLWFHPWNLGSSPRMMDWVDEILQAVAEYCDRGQMRVMTMGELATEVKQRGQGHLHFGE